MTTTLLFRSFAPVFLICTAFFASAGAQSVQPSSNDTPIHVELRVLTATPDQKASVKLPAKLSAVSRHVTEMVGPTDLRIAETYIGRIGHRGSMNYKSLANVAVYPGDIDTPSIMEWNLTRVEIGLQGSLTANSFNFGARIPIRGARLGTDANATRVVNYEYIGVSLGELTVPNGVPTLIGSLSLPNSEGTMFLVLTLSTGTK